MDPRSRGAATTTGSSPPASLLEHYHYDRLRTNAADDDEDDGCCDNSAGACDDDELDLMTVVRGGSAPAGGHAGERQPLLSVVKSARGSASKPYGAHLDYAYLSRKGLTRAGGKDAFISGSIYPSLGDSGFAGDSGHSGAVVVVTSGAAGGGGGAARRFQVSFPSLSLRPLSLDSFYCPLSLLF